MSGSHTGAPLVIYSSCVYVALRRYVHAVHHESHNPGPWSGLAFHPVEAAVFFSAYTLVLLWPWPFSWAVW